MNNTGFSLIIIIRERLWKPKIQGKTIPS